jgi:putative DNA primase/helicase
LFFGKSAAEWLGIRPTQKSPIVQPIPQEDQCPQTIQYAYLAPDGTVIAHIYRHETAEGKNFNCFDVVNQIYKVPNPRPLYNLPNVAQSEHIILCEGEKCADALISVGYCVGYCVG